MTETKKILMVDDDENLLNSFKRGLRNRFEITISVKPLEALELIRNNGNFAVIISDYKMPEVDGNKFLSIVKDISPDSSRILLTGFADINIAIDAINNGSIFRFLTKPVSINQLIKALEDSLEQHRLKTVEKDLLHNTLMGALKILMELMSLQNENIAKQSSFFRNLAKKIANRLGERNTWALEVSAILSQIGCLAIPNHIIFKKYSGVQLSDEEQQMFSQHPQIGKNLLNKIPRMEEVAETIGNQSEKFKKDITPINTSILQVLTAFSELSGDNKSHTDVIDLMLKEKERFNPEVLAALEAEIIKLENKYLVKSYNLNQLPIGSILLQDLFDINGLMLIPKGMEVSEIMLYKLKNYNKVTKVVQPVKVSVRAVASE